MVLERFAGPNVTNLELSSDLINERPTYQGAGHGTLDREIASDVPLFRVIRIARAFDLRSVFLYPLVGDNEIRLNWL